MFTKVSSLLAVLGLVISHALAVESGNLTGHITDRHSGEPLPGANIILKGTNIGGAADQNGYFVIKNIPVGRYTAQAQRIGYAAGALEIEVRAGESTSMNFSLVAEAVKFREVLVTATRQPALDSEVAVAAEIVTQAQIERTRAQNVGEVLESLTGVFVKNYGHLGALKTASIRGASENQVLVLLDGQRLNLAQGTAPDLSDIPLQAVERIEVIRGGHSALYGTDAVGGVINLITRTPNNTGSFYGKVNSGLGSFGTRLLEANFGQKLGSFDYFFVHSYTESDGDFKFNDAAGEQVERTNNRVKWNDSFLKMRLAVTPAIDLSGFFQFHDAARGSPGPLSFPSETAIQKDRVWRYNLRYQQRFSEKLFLQGQTYLYKTKQNFDDPQSFFPLHSEHKNDAYGVTLQSNWLISSFSTFAGGYEFRTDEINSTDVSRQKRTTHSLFLQDQVNLPLARIWPNSRFSFIPAARVDKFSDKDVQLSPKMGFLFNRVAGLQMVVRGSFGRSYRLPSFNDLYWPEGPFTAGNPDLKPEKGLGYDLGGLINFQKNGHWGVEVNYFHTDLKNMILWIPDSVGVFRPQNIQDATIKGAEGKLTFQGFGDLLDVAADYTYLDAVDNSADPALKGKQLIYRPKHKVDFSATLTIQRLELTASHVIVARRFTTADNSGVLRKYKLTSVSGAWKQPLAGGHLRIQLEVRNLFDKHIEIIKDFPAPGREWRTALGFAF